jgi:hypothetical protein
MTRKRSLNAFERRIMSAVVTALMSERILR